MPSRPPPSIGSRRRELWGLADDLEHVLEHREARDRLVFETASWALAARRMPAEARRSRWREALPAVVAADRLRDVPLLRFASVGQLLRLAGAGRTVRPEPGLCLYAEGASAADVRLLLEGPIAVQVGEASAAERPAPQALGLEAVLAGERQRETVWAGEGAVFLEVAAGDLLGLVCEDSSLLRRVFRALLSESTFETRVLRPCRAVEAPGVAGAQTLEVVHVLEGSPLFARATPEQLLHLAQLAREVTLAPGSILFDEPDPGALYVVASGDVTLEGEGRAGASGGAGRHPGRGRGARRPARGPRRGESAGTVLRIDGDALLERLAADTALLQGAFAALLGARRRHEAPGA